jgi:hypothetical protein
VAIGSSFRRQEVDSNLLRLVVKIRGPWSKMEILNPK